MVKQISIFVENKPGRVKEILQAIARANVNMKALSLADTTEYGVMRIIVDDCDAVKSALDTEGVIMRVGDIIAIAVEDKVGALTEPFSVLCDNNIPTEYVYAFAEKLDGYIRQHGIQMPHLDEQAVKICARYRVCG